MSEFDTHPSNDNGTHQVHPGAALAKREPVRVGSMVVVTTPDGEECLGLCTRVYNGEGERIGATLMPHGKAPHPVDAIAPMSCEKASGGKRKRYVYRRLG